MRDADSNNFFVSVTPEIQDLSTTSWGEGFVATMSYNNMPFVENIEEKELFDNIPIDRSFIAADNIREEYLPYYDDLLRAKNLEHLRYLEGRVQKAIDRRNELSGAPITSTIAGSVVDPLFALNFVPGINIIKNSATIGKATYNAGKVGLAYGVASEARRAPFAVGDLPYESQLNIATDTIVSGAFGGIVKGADPFIRSSGNKLKNLFTGKKFNHAFDDNLDKAKLLDEVGEDDYDAVVGNPFGSFGQRILARDDVPQEIKEAFIKLSYNSSVPLSGTARKAVPQSVIQRSFVYEGSARRMEDTLRNLHSEQMLGNKRASKVFGAYTADFNPFNKSFDDWIEDTIDRYIKLSSPDPAVVRSARDGLSNQQKQAHSQMKEFFESFDQDARYVGLLMDDAEVSARIAKIDESIADKADKLAKLEADIRKQGSFTKKQETLRKTLDDEVESLRARRVGLEDVLQSPTRKNYVFPIYYDKIKLKDNLSREELEGIFKQHYTREGLPDPETSAKNTLSRIMEENADDLELETATGNAGSFKHLKHRKTNIDEHLINNFMVKNMNVFYTYAQRMGKRIEFQRAFDGQGIDQVLDSLEKTARKAGLKEKDIATIRSQFNGEYDRVMGSLLRNPDSFTNQTTKALKSYTGWAYLPFAGISAVSDGGSIVLAHGYKDVISAGRAGLQDNLVGKVLKDAQYANVAVELAKASVQQRILGDSIKSIQMNKLEKVQSVGNRFFYTLNGLGPITQAGKTLDQILVNDKFYKLAQKRINNSISVRDNEFLNRYGIDDELAQYITEMPFQKHDSSKFFFANTDNWPRSTAQERDLLRKYQSATAAHTDNTIVMGQAFDRPLIMDGVTYIRDNPFFKAARKVHPNLFAIDKRASTATTKLVRIESQAMTIPFTFMNFVFGANNKILGAIRDPYRKYRVQGATALIGLSYLSFEIKNMLGSAKWWEREDESLDVMARLVDHSGLLGIYSDLGYMGLSIAGNLADNPSDFIIEPKYVSRDKDERMTDAITEPLGAPVSLALGYARAFQDYMNGDTADAAREIIYNTPILSIPMIRQDINDLLSGRGRF